MNDEGALDPPDVAPTQRLSAGAVDAETVFLGSRAPVMVPERVGPFRILGEIGRGGMGVVLRAVDPEVGRAVALKILPGGGDTDPDLRARFEREIELSGRLRHPNIVRVHAAGTSGDWFYYAMELVEGDPLDRWLARAPGDPADRIARLLPIADALAHAHRRGVVHRDLKPANILIDPDGRPRVVDFGLARSLFGGEKLTRTGAILGTPAYMAPEQIDGSFEVGPPADVFALGVVFYEALARVRPFDAPTLEERIARLLSETPRALPEIDPRIPGDLDRIVRKCLAVDPARRYPDAGRLAEDLRRFLAGQRVEARVARPRSRRRTPLQALLAAAAAGAIAVFLLHDRGLAPGEPRGDGAVAAIETGWRRLDAGDPAGAREAFARALGEPAAPPALLAEARAGLSRVLAFEGRLEAAYSEADRAVELEPNSVRALAARGELAAALGRDELAARDLGRALELGGDDFGLALRLVESLVRLVEADPGLAEPARAAARTLALAIRLAPERDPRPFALRGRLREALGDTAGAIEEYGRAIERSASHVPSLLGRARLTCDPVAALADLEQAARSEDPDPGYRVDRANALLALGRPAEALSLLEGSSGREAERLSAEAAIALGDEVRAALEAGRAVASGPGEAGPATGEADPARPPGPACLLAETLLRLGRLEDAVALGRLLAFRYPADGRAHRALARALALAEGPLGAGAAYRAALRWRPADASLAVEAGASALAAGDAARALELARGAAGPEGAILAARALLELGRAEEALTELDHPALAGAGLEARRLRIRALGESGRGGEAARARVSLEQELGRRRREARAQVDEGNRRFAAERPVEALDAFGHAIEIDPDFAEAYQRRGLAAQAIFVVSGDTTLLARGLVDLCQAMRRQPASADLFLFKPAQTQAMVDPRRLVEAIDRDLLEGPIDAAHYAARGFLRAAADPSRSPSERDLGTAVTDFDLALRLDPDFVIARALRGGVRLRLGERDLGRVDLEAAFAVAGDVCMVRYLCASLEASTGRAEAAVALLERVVERFPAMCDRIRSDPAFQGALREAAFADFLRRRCPE